MRMRALPTRVIGVAIATLAIVAPAPRVGAAPTSSCTARSGVTVIVDLSYFHRDIERGCAPGLPASALVALHAAGFSTAGTAQYGDAFVCRINDLPSRAKESCAQTPPARASWSFYSARPADSQWTYATTAVTSYRPPAGSIVAFAFGNYAKPGIPPSAALVPVTTTTSMPTPLVTIAPTAATVSVPAGPTTTAATSGTTATIPPPTERTTTSITRPVTTTSAATRAATTSGSAPRIIDRTAARTVPHDGSGSPGPAVLAVALAAILAVAGGLTIRARRRPA